MNSSASYGTPPAPPSLSAGSIPSRRLPSNVPTSCDPPACVQNAMMTKDKKPFTYTPGGIDLSQIKSPRMAKRIARNAQYEGVTGVPKPSPLAQPNSTQQNPLPPAPLGASALGMPVQVFPNGPPPPPPPQPNRNQLAPQANGLDSRRSPTPQNFEPPPLGCRPEIKIPPNPMASLKKVPKPREKNDFWVEEYRKERSASPMVNNTDIATNNASNEQSEQNYREPSPINQLPQPTPQTTQSVNYNTQRQARSPSPPTQYVQVQPPTPSTPSQTPALSSPGAYQQVQSQNRVESPFQTHDSPSLQRPLSPIKMNQPSQMQQTQPPLHVRSSSQSQGVSSPPIKQQYPQQQSQQQKNAQVGSLYIPPVPQENLTSNRQSDQQSPPLQQQFQQRSIQANNPPTPRWMAQKPPMREVPEWVRDENDTPQSSVHHVQAPQSPQNYVQQTPQPPSYHQGQQTTQTPSYYAQQTPQSSSYQVPQSPVHHVQAPQTFPNNINSANPGLRIQITAKPASNAKERIIPIQIEQSPTPTRTPATPGFGPQPFYNANQQFSSVPSPGSGYTSPTNGYNSPNQTPTRNPNQFVDQGYNNIPVRWSAQQRVTSPPAQQSPTPSSASSSNGTRIIPIAVEGQDGPFNPNAVRGPISSSPMVIQNGNYRLIVHDCPLEAEIRYRKSRLSDPRSLQHQQSWGNGTPNQSKSFKILQKLTDTEDDKDNNIDQQQLQRPQYSRQMSSAIGGGQSDVSPPSDQMRRIQLNDHDQAFMNRVKNQVPIQRVQPPRYVQQRPDFQQNEQPQPYIHPSEQQVPEPKKYTGSAIPSRSFKILQAMTTPENAGPGQSDL